MNLRRKIAPVLILAAIGVVAFFFYRPPLNADVATHTVQVGNTSRSFRVVVPHTLMNPAPVVFAFHGVGDTPEAMAEYTGWDRLAAQEGFLLVYPAGHNASWDAVEVKPELVEENADVQFFDALLKQIEANYPIDQQRIYLVGMSNGAAFAQLLAHARSTKIAAVVAHSGICPKGLNPSERKFPILLIVGGEDYAADAIRAEIKRYPSAGHEATLIEVDGLGHAWAKQMNWKTWEFLASHSLVPEK